MTKSDIFKIDSVLLSAEGYKVQWILFSLNQGLRGAHILIRNGSKSKDIILFQWNELVGVGCPAHLGIWIVNSFLPPKDTIPFSSQPVLLPWGLFDFHLFDGRKRTVVIWMRYTFVSKSTTSSSTRMIDTQDVPTSYCRINTIRYPFATGISSHIPYFEDMRRIL